MIAGRLPRARGDEPNEVHYVVAARYSHGVAAASAIPGGARIGLERHMRHLQG